MENDNNIITGNRRRYYVLHMYQLQTTGENDLSNWSFFRKRSHSINELTMRAHTGSVSLSIFNLYGIRRDARKRISILINMKRFINLKSYENGHDWDECALAQWAAPFIFSCPVQAPTCNWFTRNVLDQLEIGWKNEFAVVCWYKLIATLRIDNRAIFYRTPR